MAALLRVLQLCALLLACSLPAGFAQGAEAAALPSKVRIGSWNVYNYLAMDRHYDAAYRRDYPKPEAEKTAMRQILLEVRPDILVLQEIGGAAYLRELQADLKREGLDYPYSAFPAEASGERSVAVLSRYPWVRTEQAELHVTYFGKRQPVLRGLREVVYQTPSGTHWSLYTLHLKSRYTTRKDDPESRTLRTAEATAIRNHIARTYAPEAGYRYLIAGDFNDLQDSAPLRRFLTRGKATLARIVPCYDSRGEVWTYFYAKQATYQLVDYILASPAMWPHAGQGHIADQLPQSRIASDHRLVYVDLDLSF